MATTQLEFKPDNWLENAGIIGLTRILRPDQYKIEKYTDSEFNIPEYKLLVDVKALDTFVNQYFDYFIDKYGKYTRYQRILDKKQYLLKLKEDNFKEFDNSKGDLTKDDIKALTDQYDDTVKYAFCSLKSFDQTAQYLHSRFDEISQVKSMNKLETELKQKKTLSNPKLFDAMLREFVDKWLEIIAYLEQDKPAKYYQAKLLGYNIIQNAWSNASFLDPANMSKVSPDIFENFKKVFVQPIRDYLDADHSKDKYQCATCGRTYKRKKDVRPITFLNDMGYDFGKKQSNAWNLQNTLYVCPICQLMYVSIPAGFAYNMMHQGIFVNSTFNINVLKRENDNILNRMINNLNTLTSFSTYRALSLAYQKEVGFGQNYALKNVQIVTYNKDHYQAEITSNMMSSVLSKAAKYTFKSGDTLLESLMHMYINDYKGQKPYSIFDVIMQCLLNNTSLDNLIYELTWLKLTNTKGVHYSASGIMSVILLNNLMINYRNDQENKLNKLKGNTDMAKTNLTAKDLHTARFLGILLYRAYDSKNSVKKLQGIAYKLSNSIKNMNIDSYMDTLSSAYEYIQNVPGLQIPEFFTDNLNNSETFKQYAQAFNAALIGTPAKKDNK